MGIKLEYQEPGIYELRCDACKEEQLGPVRMSIICEKCGEELKKILEEHGIGFEFEMQKIVE